MPSTPDHNLDYPGPDDAPDGPVQLKALALAAERELAALLSDSGVRSDMAITAAAGWSVATKTHRVIGKKCYVRWSFQRDGADLVANDTASPPPGNLVDTLVATIDDVTLRPALEVFTIFRASVTSGSAEVHTDGTIRLADAHTGSTISTGNNVNIAAQYPLP